MRGLALNEFALNLLRETLLRAGRPRSRLACFTFLPETQDFRPRSPTAYSFGLSLGLFERMSARAIEGWRARRSMVSGTGSKGAA
jgi:hypothetical protein